MLHQIRKMVGLAIMMVRTKTPVSLITKTFEKPRLFIPKAPALGLLLERTVYEAYNKRLDKIQKPEERACIDFTPFESQMNAFKEEWIYSKIIKEELDLGSFEGWLRSVDERPKTYAWFLRPDGSILYDRQPDEGIKDE